MTVPANNSSSPPACLVPLPEPGTFDDGSLPSAALLAVCFLVASHALTLPALLLATRTMYLQVSIEHSVFVLLFQEMLVLSAGEIVMALVLVASQAVTWCFGDFLVAYLLVAQFLVLVHQVNWFFVTVLR